MKAYLLVGTAAVGVAFAACNTFTGAGDLEVTPGAVGPTGPTMALADGVKVTGIAVYQGLKSPLMEDGEPVVTDIPIVARREALLRVFYERTDGETAPKRVTLRVTLESTDAPDTTGASGEGGGVDTGPIEIENPISPLSTDAQLGSTLNVKIPAERMLPNTRYRVEVLEEFEATSGENTAAAWPAPDEDLARLPAQTVGPLHLRLVPIRYNADGSGREPDVSDGTIAQYERAFFEVYPVPSVKIKVDPMWDTDIPAQTSGGFGQLLDALGQYRADDASAMPFEYFYGIFDPGGTDGIAGLASLGFSPDSRVGIGLAGQMGTAIHEVGHEHQRPHSPGCGANGADPEWPRMEPEATLGTWGYNIVTGQLFDPAGEQRDFMSYCNPEWISDYVWNQLFVQSQSVNPPNDFFDYRPPPRDKHYARLRLNGDGTATFIDEIVLRHEAQGMEDITVNVMVDDVPVTRTGTYFPYDHLEGGVLFVPVIDYTKVESATFSFRGRAVSAVR